MHYSVLHISILIDLLLVNYNIVQEENLKGNRKGLVELQKEIEFDVEKEANRSEKQYLYKLNDRLGKAIQLEEKSITVKDTFVQHCINYLNYDSYKDFEGRVSFVHEQLEKKTQSNANIRFLFPKERKNRIAGDIEAAQNQDQNLEFIQGEYSTQKISEQKFITNKISKEALIWFVSVNIFQENSLFIQRFFFENKDQSAHVLPFFLTLKEKELEGVKGVLQVENVLGYEGDLAILVQLLIRFQTRKQSESGKEKPSAPTTLIKDNNNVVLGDVKIKSRYFNNGDMYINETK